MTTVTGFTAERMQEIEDSCIVNGAVVLDDLHLTTKGGLVINAGSVRGPIGPQGPQGVPGVTSASSPLVCTSATRPGSPAVGLNIFESDTNRQYVWNSVYWDPVNFQPSCRVYKNGNTPTDDTSTPVNILFNTETFDPFNMHDPVVNPQRVTFPILGKWLVWGSLQFVANPNGYRTMLIRFNNDTAGSSVNSVGGMVEGSPTSTSGVTVSQTTLINVTAVTDYVVLTGIQTSGVPLDIVGVSNKVSSELWAVRLGS